MLVKETRRHGMGFTLFLQFFFTLVTPSTGQG